MKSVMPMLRQVAHDVPQDRLPADLDHRLGPVLGLLAHARAETTREQDRLHPSTLPSGVNASI